MGRMLSCGGFGDGATVACTMAGVERQTGRSMSSAQCARASGMRRASARRRRCRPPPLQKTRRHAAGKAGCCAAACLDLREEYLPVIKEDYAHRCEAAEGALNGGASSD